MNWQKVPFSRLLLPFIVGIIFCEYAHTSHQEPIIIGIGSIVMYAFAYFFKIKVKNKPKWHLNALIQMGCVSVGMLLHASHQELSQQHHFANLCKGKAIYLLKIKEIKHQDSLKLRAVVEVKNIKSNFQRTQSCAGKAILYLSKPKQNLEIDDWLVVNSTPKTIAQPKYPWQFDYKKYLKNKQIYHQFYIKDEYLIRKNTSQSILKAAYKSKIEIETSVKRHYKTKASIGLILALLTGDKTELDEEMQDNFSKTGTMHVLAVSGLHVGLIFTLLNFVFLFLKRLPKGYILHYTLVVSGLWYFAFITGMGSSVMRATMMFSLAQTALFFKRKNNSLNSVLACAFGILIFNSNLLFDIGFQLSFAAVVGILYSQKFKFHSKGKFRKAKQYFIESLKISFFAQLFTMPIVLYNFHQFPVYFLLSNLLIIPLIGFLMYGLIAQLIFQNIVVVSTKLIAMNSVLIDWMDCINRMIGNFRHALIEHIYFTAISSILLYLSLIVLTESWKRQSKTRLIFGSITLSLMILINQFYCKMEHQTSKTYMLNDQLFVCIKGQEIYVLKNSENIEQKAIKKLEKEVEKSHFYMIKGQIDLAKSSKTDNFWIKKGLGFQIFDTIMTRKNQK